MHVKLVIKKGDVAGDISTRTPIELDMQYSTMKNDEGSLAQST